VVKSLLQEWREIRRYWGVEEGMRVERG